MRTESIVLFVSIIKLLLVTAVRLQSVFLRSEDWTVIKRIAAASHVCFFQTTSLLYHVWPVLLLLFNDALLCFLTLRDIN